jgi:outer membrane protein assembly factor BamB
MPEKIRWKTSLPGEGHSSPTVWGKRLFVTSAEAEKNRRSLHCLDAKSGRLLWTKSFTFAAYHTHEFNDAASATCALDKERVFSVWPSESQFTVVAHDHSGRERWKRELGAFPTQHGGGASPVVFGDLLLVPREPENAEGSLLALDVKTGLTRWEARRPSLAAPYGAPLLYQPDKGPPQVVMASTALGVTSYDPLTGKLLWQQSELLKLRYVSSPIQMGSRVVVGSGTGGGERLLVALNLDPQGKNPSIAWRLTRGAPYVPTPIFTSDLLYLWGDGGVVTCVKPESGEQVWQERAGGDFSGSPVCAGGRLWAVSVQGELISFAPDRNPTPFSRVPLEAPSRATPAVAGGRLFVRTLKHVFCL